MKGKLYHISSTRNNRIKLLIKEAQARKVLIWLQIDKIKSCLQYFKIMEIKLNFRAIIQSMIRIGIKIREKILLIEK